MVKDLQFLFDYAFFCYIRILVSVNCKLQGYWNLTLWGSEIWVGQSYDFLTSFADRRRRVSGSNRIVSDASLNSLLMLEGARWETSPNSRLPTIFLRCLVLHEKLSFWRTKRSKQSLRIQQAIFRRFVFHHVVCFYEWVLQTCENCCGPAKNRKERQAY